jgi:hypothetical protein
LFFASIVQTIVNNHRIFKVIVNVRTSPTTSWKCDRNWKCATAHLAASGFLGSVSAILALGPGVLALRQKSAVGFGSSLTKAGTSDVLLTGTSW